MSTLLGVAFHAFMLTVSTVLCCLITYQIWTEKFFKSSNRTHIMRRNIFVSVLASLVIHAANLVNLSAVASGTEASHAGIDIAGVFFDFRTASAMTVFGDIVLIIMSQARVAVQLRKDDQEPDVVLYTSNFGRVFLYLCVVANGVLRAHYNTYVFTMIIEATCIVFVIVLFVFVWLSVYQLAAHLRALAAAASPGVREIDISGYYKFLALGNALFVVVIVFLILSLANNIANVHCLSCVPYYEKQPLFDLFSPFILALLFMTMYQTWRCVPCGSDAAARPGGASALGGGPGGPGAPGWSPLPRATVSGSSSNSGLALGLASGSGPGRRKTVAASSPPPLELPDVAASASASSATSASASSAAASASSASASSAAPPSPASGATAAAAFFVETRRDATAV